MVVIDRLVRWLTVAGRWTRVSVMGACIAEELDGLGNLNNCSRTVVLMIPGNPGNEGFYEHFGRNLLLNLNARAHENSDFQANNLLFITVSHLNHVKLPLELENRGEHNSNERFNLTTQVDHKLSFCKENLSSATKIYLVGHSIGSYIMLRILPLLVENGFAVSTAFALFPTIERMLVSPKGRQLYPTLRRLDMYDSWVKPFIALVGYVPEKLKYWLCKLILSDASTPSCVINAAVELWDVNVIRNIVHMSVDELNTVSELDELLIQYKELIRFYYGTNDAWCPITYGKEMLDRLGKDIVAIDDEDCEHAFVVKNGEVLARKLIPWIL